MLQFTVAEVLDNMDLLERGNRRNLLKAMGTDKESGYG